MYHPNLVRKATSSAVEIEFHHRHAVEGAYYVCGEAGHWFVGYKGTNADGSTFRNLDVAGPFDDSDDADRLADDMNADRDKLRAWLSKLTATERKYMDHLAAKAGS